jgi:hypothetical protein
MSVQDGGPGQRGAGGEWVGGAILVSNQPGADNEKRCQRYCDARDTRGF